jgi:AraC-like DNA-binding protein
MFVSVLMVRILLDECRGRGFEPAQLLDATGISSEQLEDGRARVPSEDFERLARRALSLTQDDSLGLALGGRLPAQALQVIGYLLTSAPTLRKAYADFERFASVLAEGPSWALREDVEARNSVREQNQARAHFEVRCPIPHANTQRMANEWSLSLAYRMICAFAPAADSTSASVAFAHPQPRDGTAYAAVFAGAVRFGQKRNVVSFPRAWLDLPQAHGDAVTCEGLREMAERLLTTVGSQRRLSDQLRLILRRETQLSGMDVAELSRRVGLSQSALRRRLSLEGVSPSQLVDEARCRVACVELARMDRSVKQLADELGYAEPSSFHRAFKRWTGKTPADYRAGAL